MEAVREPEPVAAPAGPAQLEAMLPEAPSAPVASAPPAAPPAAAVADAPVSHAEADKPSAPPLGMSQVHIVQAPVAEVVAPPPAAYNPAAPVYNPAAPYASSAPPPVYGNLYPQLADAKQDEEPASAAQWVAAKVDEAKADIVAQGKAVQADVVAQGKAVQADVIAQGKAVAADVLAQVDAAAAAAAAQVNVALGRPNAQPAAQAIVASGGADAVAFTRELARCDITLMSDGTWAVFATVHNRRQQIATAASEAEARAAALFVAPPVWKPNAPTCACCQAPFGVVSFSSLGRAHHCRSCGNCVCGPCSRGRWPADMVPPAARDKGANNKKSKVRVCTQCHAAMEEWRTALMDADLDRCRAIVAGGLVNVAQPFSIFPGRDHAVHLAAKAGSLPLLRWLVEELRVPLFPAAAAGSSSATLPAKSVLWLAAELPHAPMMRWLIADKGCSAAEIPAISTLQRAMDELATSDVVVGAAVEGAAEEAKRDDDIVVTSKATFSAGALGMRLEDLGGRCVVTNVRPLSQAERAGVVAGSVLTHVRNQPVDHAGAVQALSDGGRPVLVHFETAEKRRVSAMSAAQRAAIDASLEATDAQAALSAVAAAPPVPASAPESAASTGDDECVVCLDRAINVVLTPCGHYCVCGECAGQLDGECPVCRAEIAQVVRIYHV